MWCRPAKGATLARILRQGRQGLGWRCHEDRDEENEGGRGKGQGGRGEVSREGKLWRVSWWHSGGIMCFVSAHTGSRCARHKGGFTLRSGMCWSRGSFPRLTRILALQYHGSSHLLLLSSISMMQGEPYSHSKHYDEAPVNATTLPVALSHLVP